MALIIISYLSRRIHAQMDIFEICAANDIDALRRQIEKDISLVEAVDYNGNTVLHIAALNGNWNMCEELVELCDVFAFNKAGMLPQHLAFDSKHTKLAMMLRDHGDSIGEHHLLVQTPGREDLHISLQNGELTNIDFILSGMCGILQGETHRSTYRGAALPPRLPRSSPQSPIVIEFVPEVVYFKVHNIEGCPVLVKLNYDQPLSRILDTPGLSEYQYYSEGDVVLTWEDNILDLRNPPAVYNIPCTIDPPQMLLFRHSREDDPLSPSCKSLSRSFLESSLRPVSSSSSM